jgi:RNA polymerase sigma factor (sigma-70 family)
MLTVFEDHERIFQSLEAGASGYLLKHTPPSKLIEAIFDLEKGGSPISTPIARKLVESFQRPSKNVGGKEINEHLSALSPRETQIIQLLAKGHRYKEIADELRISVETIRTHLHNIYEKLHVRSRTEAVMKVYGKLE